MEYFKGFGVNIKSYLTFEQEDVIGRDLNTDEISRWKSIVRNKNFTQDIIITHNVEGEYGHNHHRVVNSIATELYSNIWEFICPGAVNVAPQPFKSKINVIPLSLDILNKKTEIFNRCYTSELACWKVLPEIMQYEFRTGPEIFTSA